MDYTDDRNKIRKYIEEELDFALNASREDEWVPALAGRINEMIRYDFQRLMTILYRLDVSELKLKKLLSEQKDEDAGTIIARLVIERQMQKLRTWRAFNDSNADTGTDENEKW